MKVVLATPYFYPHLGGVEVYTLNIGKRLRAHGWTVVIVTTGPGVAARVEDVEGMKVYRLRVSRTVFNTPIGWGWRRKLRRIYEAEQPDVVNAHTPVPFLADVAQRVSGGTPFVLTYHNDLEKDSLPQKAITRLVNRALTMTTLRRATAIIATSDYYVRGSRYLRPHASKTSVVPPGVDLARFHPAVTVGDDLAERYAGRRVVLFVGSLNRSQQHKGLDALIRAFGNIHSEFPDARLVIVGSGDGLGLYQSIVNSAGAGRAVEFAGAVADHQLPQYYKLASVFAMPSTNRSEGFGMVYMEASAVGVPVIGTNVGGVPYAVKHDHTGLIIEPRDVDALSQALRSLLGDSERAGRLGRAGAARAAAEFGWDALAARTSQVLTAVVRERGARQPTG